MAIRISAIRCCSACFPVIRVNCLPTCIGYDPCYLRAMAEAALGNRTQASGASQPAGSFSEVHRRLPWQVLSMYTCPLQYEWSPSVLQDVWVKCRLLTGSTSSRAFCRPSAGSACHLDANSRTEVLTSSAGAFQAIPRTLSAAMPWHRWSFRFGPVSASAIISSLSLFCGRFGVISSSAPEPSARRGGASRATERPANVRARARIRCPIFVDTTRLPLITCPPIGTWMAASQVFRRPRKAARSFSSTRAASSCGLLCCRHMQLRPVHVLCSGFLILCADACQLCISCSVD